MSDADGLRELVVLDEIVPAGKLWGHAVRQGEILRLVDLEGQQAVDFRPYGLYGGGPGKPSMNYLNLDSENRPLSSKLTMTIRRGDTFRHEVAGPGGWGDPLERDPAMGLKDGRNELVSERSAREDYGVVLADKPLSVDEAATRAVREKLRHARNWPHEPMISWEPPVIAMAAE